MEDTRDSREVKWWSQAKQKKGGRIKKKPLSIWDWRMSDRIKKKREV